MAESNQHLIPPLENIPSKIRNQSGTITKCNAKSQQFAAPSSKITLLRWGILQRLFVSHLEFHLNDLHLHAHVWGELLGVNTLERTVRILYGRSQPPVSPSHLLCWRKACTAVRTTKPGAAPAHQPTQTCRASVSLTYLTNA